MTTDFQVLGETALKYGTRHRQTSSLGFFFNLLPLSSEAITVTANVFHCESRLSDESECDPEQVEKKREWKSLICKKKNLSLNVRRRVFSQSVRIVKAFFLCGCIVPLFCLSVSAHCQPSFLLTGGRIQASSSPPTYLPGSRKTEPRNPTQLLFFSPSSTCAPRRST